MTATPGALRSGFTGPPHGDGPRPLKDATWSSISVAPAANASDEAPGLRTLPSPGPLLPAANDGKIPAARSARMSAVNSPMHPPRANPQELFTTSGAFAGLPPGARNHWKISWNADARPSPESSHAFAAIQRAP